MSANPGDQGSFLPTTEIFEAIEIDELNRQIGTVINDHALVINQKDTGIYDTQQFVNGQTWFPNTSPLSGQPQGLRRPVFRKVINFGSLPNTATKSVAHGISTNSNFSFTRIYGSATDQGGASINSAIPLPFASPTLNQNISLTVDATNVNVTTGINRTNFTICYIVLEWIVS